MDISLEDRLRERQIADDMLRFLLERGYRPYELSAFGGGALDVDAVLTEVAG